MKFLKIAGMLLLIIIVVVAVFIATYQPKKYSDFGVYTNLQQQMLSLLEHYGASERPITQEFVDFAVDLSFPFNKLFGSPQLGVPLKSYATKQIAVATISQFEIPPGSGYYRDFTLNIRPAYALKAPVLHIDFMKPAAGAPGMCILDFFNVAPDAVNYDEFFGPDLATVKKALAAVAKYQRTVEDGRGKISRYLDPYKSPYRFELKEPKTKDDAVRKEYFQTVEAAILQILPVYMQRLTLLPPDPDFARTHEANMQNLVREIYAKDFAVSMGRKIFKEHFKKYWLDGFWNVQVVLTEP